LAVSILKKVGLQLIYDDGTIRTMQTCHIFAQVVVMPQI
jgi:hypothetical protein